MTRGRRKRLRRLRLDRLDDVPKGEVVRWDLGRNIWAWPELFKVYEQVRDEYLARFSSRWPDRTPGIEKLRQGWLAKGEAGAEAAAAELRQLERESDPRRTILIGGSR